MLFRDRTADGIEAVAYRMRVSRQHRLDPVSCDLSEVGIVDASGAEVGDVAVGHSWGRMSRPEAS